MTDETPSDRLRRERDIIRARGLAQSPSDQFWGSGNSANTTSGDSVLTMPLNNGPRPYGGIAARIDGGISQSEGLSRTQPKRRVGLPTDKYPFKTISSVYELGITRMVLGGDRTPHTIYAQYGVPQLVNAGGKSNWRVSLFLGGSNLKFFNPDSDATIELLGFTPQGNNIWANTALPAVQITKTRRAISGDPPTVESQFPILPNLISTWNFVGAYDETAKTLYTNATINSGTITWSANTSLGTLTQTQNQTIAGTCQYPVSVFRYSPDQVVASGTRVRSRTTNLNSNFSRAQTWENSTKIETISDEAIEQTIFQVPIIGSQSLEYSSKLNQTYNSTITDNRSVDGGTHADTVTAVDETFTSEKIDPIASKLHGQGAVLCSVAQTGFSSTKETRSSASVTSQTVTRVIRPSMKNVILYTSQGYLYSGGLTGWGTLGRDTGGFYNSSLPPVGTPGNRAPDAAVERANIGFDSILKAEDFDAPGAYGDNTTSPPEVYSEYTLVEGRSIRGNIYTDVLNWGTDYNWTYSFQMTVTDTITYRPPIAYKLVTPSQILEIASEQTAINSYIDPAIVSAPDGPGILTVSSSSPFGLPLETSILRERKIVTTTGRQINNGTTISNTTQEANTYTSEDLSIIGKRAEVYRTIDGKIKRWSGTIQAYDGDKAADPLPFRDLGNGRTETNTLVGPYPKTIQTKTLTIAIDKVEVDVKHCPWGIGSDRYLIVLNSDFAIMKLLDYRWCNLVAGTGDSLAKIYVASAGYQAGKVNYAAVWEFVRSGGGCRAVKKEDVKGKTKKGIQGETLQAVQYFPI